MSSAPKESKLTVDGRPIVTTSVQDVRTETRSTSEVRDEMMRSYMGEADVLSAVSEGTGKSWAVKAAIWIWGPVFAIGLPTFLYRAVQALFSGHIQMGIFFFGLSAFFALGCAAIFLRSKV